MRVFDLVCYSSGENCVALCLVMVVALPMLSLEKEVIEEMLALTLLNPSTLLSITRSNWENLKQLGTQEKIVSIMEINSLVVRHPIETVLSTSIAFAADEF